MVAVLVQLIFLTPDWTKLPNLLGLEKCLDYTWLQFTENGTSLIFTMKMKPKVGDFPVGERNVFNMAAKPGNSII